MIRWEYLRLGEPSADQLSALGLDGWELVGIEPGGATSSGAVRDSAGNIRDSGIRWWNAVYVFKRPLKKS